MTITTLPDNLKPAVERVAEAYYNAMWMRAPDAAWNKVDQSIRAMYVKDSEAAILTFLNDCIEAGEAREAKTYNNSGSSWVASDAHRDGDFPAIILRMGDKP
jgi:hypothetical protein